jgi:hypothetical protein
MERIIKIIIAAWMVMMITSCTESSFVQPPVDNVPPSPLTNVQVESLPGGAKITYEVPSTDKDISYVKGEYLFQGKKKTVRSSIYNDFLIIEGLGSVEPVEVTLYLVDHSENHSAPVTTESFAPGTPPLQTIFESVEMIADFGGLTVKWENVSGTEIGITIFAEDTTKVLKEAVTTYSNQKDGSYSLRGRDAVEQRFAVFFVDKWGNISDTTEVKLTPLYEKQLRKSKFSQAILPGDNTLSYPGNYMLRNLWDNNYGSLWHTDMGVTYPVYITVDLGVVAKISRMHLWPRLGDPWYFAHFSFKTFEVWGAETYNRDETSTEYWTSDDGWKADGYWTLLGDHVIVKPSGYPVGTNTNEDKEVWDAGFQYSIPLDAPPCRYLRFVAKTVWASGGAHMAEFDFYGDDGNKEID